MIKNNNQNDKTTFNLKEYFIAPIFTAKKTGETRSVIVRNKTWTIGVDNPLDSNAPIVKDLTIDHALIMFGIFSFTNVFDFTPNIPFSLHKLCQVVFGCSNLRTFKKTTQLLNELLYCWTSIEDPNSKSIKIFRILKNVNVIMKKPRRTSKKYSPELWLDGVELNKEFYALIREMENRLLIKFSLIKKITSNIAKTIYMYLPSRAIRATENNSKFKITLAKLLQQIGCLQIKHKSKRKQLFIQNNEKSIINQLNGAKLTGNKKFYCHLEETIDKTDYNFVCWVESDLRILTKPKSKLYEAYIKAGGATVDWYQRLSEIDLCEFNVYEQDALMFFPNWERSEKFLKMAKCLLKTHFAEYLGVVKNHILENKKIIKSPMHMLNNQLMEAFKNITFK